MASFDTFSVDGDAPAVTRSFDDEGYGGGFDSYTAFSSAADTPPFSGGGFPGGGYGEEEVTVETVEGSDPFGFGADQDQTPFGDSSAPISNGNGKPYDLGEDSEGIFSSDGPVLPPPNEMQEEGHALREWRRLNAIRLEEKEKLEKEQRNQILEEAEEFKRAFYEKRTVNIETNKTNNREKEQVYLAGQEKFHKEVDKHYWKAVAELIPNEVASIQKRGKKEQEKKPSITVVQGPKPGKPTDLSRMRHILVKLKHNPPPHMVPPPPAKDAKTGKDAKDAKTGKDAKDGKNAKAKDGKDAEAATSNGPVAVEATGALTKDAATTNGVPPATAAAPAEEAAASAPATSEKPAE